MRKRYAKKVYSFDLTQTIDRTKKPHPFGNFDVDFRKLDAPNPQARKWTYGGSQKTLETILKEKEKLQKIGLETRVVNNTTGEIIA